MLVMGWLFNLSRSISSRMMVVTCLSLLPIVTPFTLGYWTGLGCQGYLFLFFRHVCVSCNLSTNSPLRYVYIKPLCTCCCDIFSIPEIDSISDRVSSAEYSGFDSPRYLCQCNISSSLPIRLVPRNCTSTILPSGSIK